MAVEKWEKTESKYLVKEKWATLRVDVCRLPDGTEKDDYYVLEYPDWVNAVALTEEGKLLFVSQYRHGADIISLEIPGGVIDGDETPETAIRRELVEETGYTFESCELIATLYPNPATSTNKTYTYLLKGGKKTQEQHLDEHELLEVSTFTIEEAKQLLKENKIAQALHSAALFYGLQHL